jgi:dipeptidyl aminopeptidase/acylaminoacyl peptidase
MYLLRTRFKKKIIAEFLPPNRKSSKVIILLGGMPGVPSAREAVELLSRKGYWVFYPRYRGSWESGGKFLAKSPDRDVIDIIDQLPRGFKDLYHEKTMRVQPSVIYLIGGSFGGPAALLASRDKRVTKAVVLAPVVDWTKQSKTEPLGWLIKFTRASFGNAYRFKDRDILKLKKGKFFQPIAHTKEMDGNKIMIFHAKDDVVVPWQPSKLFADKTGSRIKLFVRGGHFGVSKLLDPKILPLALRFLRSR